MTPRRFNISLFLKKGHIIRNHYIDRHCLYICQVCYFDLNFSNYGLTYRQFTFKSTKF